MDATVMRTVYHVYMEDEDCGEVEGMFDDKGELLDTWNSNDANWRTEYFAGFMRALGVVVNDPPKRLRSKMEQKMRKVWAQ